MSSNPGPGFDSWRKRHGRPIWSENRYWVFIRNRWTWRGWTFAPVYTAVRKSRNSGAWDDAVLLGTADTFQRVYDLLIQYGYKPPKPEAPTAVRTPCMHPSHFKVVSTVYNDEGDCIAQATSAWVCADCRTVIPNPNAIVLGKDFDRRAVADSLRQLSQELQRDLGSSPDPPSIT